MRNFLELISLKEHILYDAGKMKRFSDETFSSVHPTVNVSQDEKRLVNNIFFFLFTLIPFLKLIFFADGIIQGYSIDNFQKWFPEFLFSNSLNCSLPFSCDF